MEMTDSRNMSIGQAVSLGGFERRMVEEESRIATGATPAMPSSFEDGWNHGDKPWDVHPAHTSAAFNPSHTAILHMELTSAGLKAQRVHFPSVSGVNDWSANKAKVVSYINFLNGSGPSPGVLGKDYNVFPGLKKFAFDRPHHFVIYVKNPGVDYLADRPVWFGKKLIRDVFGVKVASKNESFFGAIRDAGPILGGSPNLVYLKNYYHVGNGNGQNHRRINGERLAYALKINVLMASPDDNDPTYKVPLIIDPDTGNMGEGQPVPPGGNPSPGNVPNRN
jgi:hypothetical protein